MTREIKKIIIHCSDSEWGDAYIIDKWHKERGWKGIGYHYVVLNGKRIPNSFDKSEVGFIEKGRPDSEVGSHVVGMNSISI